MSFEPDEQGIEQALKDDVSLTDTLSGVVLAVQWGIVTLAGTLAVTWWSSRLVNRS